MIINDSHAIPANDEPEAVAAAALARLNDAYAPAKTHDLSVRREFGNVVVRAEGEEGNRLVYLQEGVAQDLGRVLDALTPAQIALLISELTGGEG